MHTSTITASQHAATSLALKQLQLQRLNDFLADLQRERASTSGAASVESNRSETLPA